MRNLFANKRQRHRQDSGRCDKRATKARPHAPLFFVRDWISARADSF